MVPRTVLVLHLQNWNSNLLPAPYLTLDPLETKQEVPSMNKNYVSSASI